MTGNEEPKPDVSPDPSQDPGSESSKSNFINTKAQKISQALGEGRWKLWAQQDPPLWRMRWFQWALGLLLILLLLGQILPVLWGIIDATRSVIAPVLLGLALAYVFDPVVSWLDAKAKLSRAGAAAALIGAVLLVLGVLGLWLIPPLLDQGVQLAKSLPAYAQQLLDLDAVQNQDLPAAATQAVADVDVKSALPGVLQALNIGIGALAATLGWVSATGLLVAVTAVCFFFFVWKLGNIKAWGAQYIPASHKPRTLELLGMMDRSVSAYIRGRLIQASVVAVILTVGWMLCGTPYWLLLGLLGGFLGLLPFVAIVAWPLAVGLAVLDATTGGITGSPVGFDLMWHVILPTVVYGIAQFVDSWIVEPIVQGNATDLDALSVLLVVLAGGALAGIIGLILAIPVAACVKILLREEIMPRLRAAAAEN